MNAENTPLLECCNLSKTKDDFLLSDINFSLPAGYVLGVIGRNGVGKLSKGQQIKQQLAFALSYKAKLYVLDEPAANLDVEFREMFYRYVRQMTEDGSSSVICVSHLVDELEQMADYILWLQEEKTDSETSCGLQKYFGEMDALKEQFQLMEISESELSGIPREDIVGSRMAEHHQELMVRISRDSLTRELQNVSRYPTLKELMYYVEKGCE